MLYDKIEVFNPANYWPIAVVNALLKWLTIILFSRLAKWLENHNVTFDGQAGFRKPRTTLDQIFVLNLINHFKLR